MLFTALLLTFSILLDPSGDLNTALRDLGSELPAKREQAIKTLQQAGGAVLPAFREAFPELGPVTQQAFQRNVLPTLPGQKAGDFMLAEFQKHLTVRRKYRELQSVADQTERQMELKATYERIRPQYNWWVWTAWALHDLAYKPAYEPLYEAMQEETAQFPVNCYARALHKIDPQRATADFEKLLRSGDTSDRIRAAYAYRATN